MKLMFWFLLIACLPSIGWVGNCISGDVIVRMTPPPGREMTPHGERCTGYPIEELFFEKPDGWETTRSVIDYFCYYDHVFDNNFGDYELTVIFAMLFQWQVPLALEVSVLKDFCPTGLEGFTYGHEMWIRFESVCGAEISLFAMDEPLWAVIDNNIGDLEYAVEETVVWMCSVRTNYPEVIIVSIEPYPALSVTKIFDWIMRLETECEMHGITGIDAFCIDPNWACVSQFDWDDVRRIEAFCDSYDLPFSLIYWSADATTSSASDRDWYDGIIMQGGAYSGTPNEYVIESWVWVPRVMTPDQGNTYTFTRSVYDFVNLYVPKN